MSWMAWLYYKRSTMYHCCDMEGTVQKGARWCVGGGSGQCVEEQGTWPHAHRNTARQATDGLWTEALGQQKQSNGPGNNQHILNTPIVGRR